MDFEIGSSDNKFTLLVYVANDPAARIYETTQRYFSSFTDWSLEYVVDVLERAMCHIESYLEPME